ncbi:glycosyltransferase [Domibacillus epiphyticus]|uniref:Glycosyl transferase n=1 Tax=Domibacillus epiphyticus TaxID=1714355 RepID=A0A1V2A530_9BACI|nr:glycosyltransferase [Domibacillus epiphyticus]OMP66119.1 hypothetical protein BTO28_14030 [Domibacillus epiphyticus]
MKIVQVTEAFGGGVYSFLVDLCNELSHDHEVIVVYSKRKETPIGFKKDFHSSIRFIPVDMSLKNSTKAIVKLTKIIKEENPDVLHLHSSKAGFVGRVAAKAVNYKGRLFYNPHGLAFLRMDLPLFARKIFLFAEKILSGLGGIVIAVSDSEKKEAQKFSSNVICINNGINLAQLDNDLLRSNTEKEEKNNIIIGSVGRIEYQKNPSLFNEIAENFPQIQFVWIGEGNLRSELKSKNIETTGWLSREEVLKKVKSFDIYIQTSLWEGLPLSVLEAMYLNKPVLVKKSTGNVDTVNKNLNGYIFHDSQEASNKINFLLNNTNVIREMGKESKKNIIDNFDISLTLNNYKTVYFEKRY